MNAIETHIPESGVVLQAEQGTDMIARTAGQLGQAYQIAEALCSTTFAPTHFREKPQEAAAAILFGSQIGLDPLASMQNIYVIGGKPALYARTMSAVVQAAGHSIWTEESTDEQVTVAGQRRGSEAIERITWSLDRAKTAGYTSNANYKKDPQAMLYARAVGDVARRIAPDALLGLSYTVEEMRVSTGASEAQRDSSPQQARPAPMRRQQPGTQTKPAPATQEGPRDWYAELDRCESADDVKKVAADLKAAMGDVPEELKTTINTLWESFVSQPAEEVHDEVIADPETGEIQEEQVA